MRLCLFLPLLLGCPPDPTYCDPAIAGVDQDTGCSPFELPEMALSVTEIDFGYVATGERVTQTIELRNDGAFPLGVSSIEIGDASPGGSGGDTASGDTGSGDGDTEEHADFDVTYDPAGVDCTWVPADPAYPFVLDPGCVLPLTVGYTATSPEEVWNALVVWSERGADRDDGFSGDEVHGQGVVWLRGTTDGVDASEDPYESGGLIWMEQTSMLEGETIRMGVRVYDPDGDAITYAWSTDNDGGTFDDPSLPEVRYTAPEIEDPGAGKNANIYAVIFDEDGHQDWAFGRVAVWDAAAPLYGECPELDADTGGVGGTGAGGWSLGEGCGSEGDCPEEECGTNAAFLLALGVLGASRRRRGAP